MENEDYEIQSTSLADNGFESFLYPPTEILNNNLSNFLQPGAGLKATDENSIKTPKDFYDKLKFMVFKVKQRAIKDYDLYREKQIAAALRNKYEIGTNNVSEKTDKLSDLKYSEVYGANWPYDYFSLIETIKLDIEVRFNQ